MPTDYYPTGPFVSQRPDLREFDELREDFLFEQRSRNTARAYKTDLQDFYDWCMAEGVNPLSATGSEVARFLGSLSASGYAEGTVKRHAAAVRGFMKRLGGRTTSRQAP